MPVQPRLRRRHKIGACLPTHRRHRPSCGSPGPVREDSGGAVVAEKQEQRVEPPKLYQVVMLNDDYTPMEFVVLVLQEHFLHDLETATQIMLKIHHEGRGICGVYSKDVAATKVELVQAAAKRAGHPLQCTMEVA
ncbi:MAG: ATP-dependent Clp protease adapter ClpS [Aquincola sp.]|nr:ATP-dependent Clp protease adapter ClpS [Aquincola sp.]